MARERRRKEERGERKDGGKKERRKQRNKEFSSVKKGGKGKSWGSGKLNPMQKTDQGNFQPIQRTSTED